MSLLPNNHPTLVNAPNHTGNGVDLVTPYLRAKVMSAKPEELRMLLLDGAVRFARQGEEGLRLKNFEQAFNGITRCRDIIVELMTSIREEHNPELAKNVRGLYTFLFNEITEANMAKSPDRMKKVVELLEYERETWAMLLESIATQKPKDGKEPKAATTHKPISLSA